MKTVVVTGPSSGIGRVTALALAELGYHVVAAGRSQERTSPVVDAIIAKGGSAELLLLDLASLDNVRHAAKELEQRGRTIDALVNNAGIGMEKGSTVDGFEINFGVNHLGPFLFTHLLRRTFRPGTRIVTVSSAMHFRVEGFDFDRLTRPSRSFLGLNDYCVSKLANILFTKEMARRQPDWRAFAVHPGFVDTGIFRPWVRPLVRNRLITPEDGAAPTIRCLTDEALESHSGAYYTRNGESTPSELAQDEDLARRLWVESGRWCEVGPVN
jgi:NAD(P)-dependent dehydrogenase (short-subunit alcohol dehydrogenase family)